MRKYEIFDLCFEILQFKEFKVIPHKYIDVHEKEDMPIWVLHPQA